MKMRTKLRAPNNGIANNEGFEMLKRLIDGNNRFLSGLRSVESIPTVGRLSKLATEGQRPFAIVLGCADSRIPAELLFDQGLGDLFIVRVAGNVVAPSLIASMEFAAMNFDTPLLVVMGHTKCGAIQSAVDHYFLKKTSLGKNLEDLIQRILPSVERVCEKNKNGSVDLNDVARENVDTSINSILEQSDILREKVKSARLLLVSAMVDIGSGRVSFGLSESVSRLSGLCLDLKYSETMNESLELAVENGDSAA